MARMKQDPSIPEAQKQNNTEIQNELAGKTKQLDDIISRIERLEGYFEGAVTDSSHYVCVDNATYDATNSKAVTIENGIIKSIEA